MSEEIKSVHVVPTNIERVKPVYFIEVQKKEEIVTYIATTCEITQGYVHFTGAIAENPNTIDNSKEVESIIKDNFLEKFIPMKSIVEITLKRFIKKQY